LLKKRRAFDTGVGQDIQPEMKLPAAGYGVFGEGE
jgi:hypothetical protein